MFPKDCAELIKALGSFDYASANKHLIKITKVNPTVGSICSRVIQCESVYSSMQFLKPNRFFRREDHLFHLYSEIATDVEREMAAIHRGSSISVSGPLLEHQSHLGASGTRHGASGHSSPVMNTSDPIQPGIHQFMSNNQGNNGAGSGVNNSGGFKSVDNAPIIGLSPTYSHLHYPGNNGEREDQTIADQIVLYTIFQELCTIRMALTTVYRLLSSSVVEINAEGILPEIEKAYNRYIAETTEIHSCVLGIGIEYEIKALKHGILLHAGISEYDIQKSAINLHLARVMLSEWRQISSEQEYGDKSYNRPEETSWRYNLFSSGEDKSKSSSAAKGKFSLQPNHNQWINKWIASERSKMTIYFMNILLEKEQAMGGDERSLWTNTDPDLHGIIRTFRKKAGAQSISLVYEISQQVRFSQSGFVSANSPYEPPTGLNSFPCIYSYPPDPPKDHWPNIISIMQGSVNILRQFRSQYFYDRKIGCTYYVARVDQHASIVIIYLDKHPQPDTGAMDFLQLLASKLRHTEALTSMRVE